MIVDGLAQHQEYSYCSIVELSHNKLGHKLAGAILSRQTPFRGWRFWHDTSSDFELGQIQQEYGRTSEPCAALINAASKLQLPRINR